MHMKNKSLHLIETLTSLKILKLEGRRIAVCIIAGCLLLLCVGAALAAPTPAQAKLTLTKVYGATGTDPAVELDKYWQNAKKIVHHSVLEIMAQHQTEMNRGVVFNKLIHGDTGRKEIALTFDDGPHTDFTPKILEILKKYHVKATFFVVGEMAERNPDLIKDEIADGNSVGNHTYHHVNLTRLPIEYVATEIKACGEVLKSITGKAPHLFRPPGGDYDKDVAIAAHSLNYTTVLWTDDPGDYASPGDSTITSRLMSRVNNGGIILIHDGVQQTVDILPDIIQRLKAQGYKFVTIDEMLAHK